MEGWSCCSNEGFEKYYEDRQSTFCLPINPKGPNTTPTYTHAHL